MVNSFDLYEIENRLLLSNNIVNKNTDIHKLTASKIFNVPYNKVTDEQRRIAKALNFKEVYK